MGFLLLSGIFSLIPPSPGQGRADHVGVFSGFYLQGCGAWGWCEGAVRALAAPDIRDRGAGSSEGAVEGEETPELPSDVGAAAASGPSTERAGHE